MYRLFGHYLPKSLIFLWLTDTLLLFISINVGLIFITRDYSSVVYLPTVLDTAMFVVVMLVSMLAMGMYRRDLRGGFTKELTHILLSLLFGFLILYFYYIFNNEGLLNHINHITCVICAFIFIILYRIYRRTLRSDNGKRVIVIGTGDKAHQLEKLRRKADRLGIDLIGYIDPASGGKRFINENRILNRPDDAQVNYKDFLLKHRIDEIVVALDEQRKLFPVQDILEAKLQGIQILEVNAFLERQLGKINLDTFHPSNFIFSDGFMADPLRTFKKRLMDLFISTCLLTATAPVMIFTALAIWLESGCRGTVVYRQERAGLNNKIFNIFKFRSMEEDAEKDGKPQWAASGDSRVTHIGRFIRSTRIDELPQLFNVLKGDMSLVGPRPERPQFVNELSKEIPFYKLRTYIKPGITGWAQICYPYGASIKDAREKLQYDLYYIKHNNFFLDFLILFQTLAVIILCKGAR